MVQHILCLFLAMLVLSDAKGKWNGTCWQQAKIMGTDTKPGDYFGGSVSVSGNLMVAVAANEDGLAQDAGAAYIFTQENTEWYQEAKLVGNDTAKKHHFGRSVSISGNSVVIGASTYEGSAYVFTRAITSWGPMWSEQQKLQASDMRGGDEFGRSVGISGDVIVVGAVNGNDDLGNKAGAAYIFARANQKWFQEAKIWGKDTHSGHYFGDIVSISGATVVVGTSPAALGAAYVFTKTQGTWKQQAKIYRSGKFGGDDFGASLAIYHNTLVIGAPGNDEGLNDAGAAYVFTRSGTMWSQQAKVFASDKAEGHRFGSVVTISDYMMAVVAQGKRDQVGNYGGSVYVFSQNGTNWIPEIKVRGKDSVFGDRLGASISMDGNLLTAGSPRQKQGGVGAGAAYVMKCMTTTTTPTPTTRSFKFGPGFGNGAGDQKKAIAVTNFARQTSLISIVLAAWSMLALWA